jgi:hypothetical protein
VSRPCLVEVLQSADRDEPCKDPRLGKDLPGGSLPSAQPASALRLQSKVERSLCGTPRSQRSIFRLTLTEWQTFPEGLHAGKFEDLGQQVRACAPADGHRNSDTSKKIPGKSRTTARSSGTVSPHIDLYLIG